MKKLVVFLALFLWAIMFVAMHLVTFDLFGDNLWFHYLIAGALLIAQLLDVVILQKTHKKVWGYFFFSIIYFILCITASWFFVSAIAMHDPSPQGLTIWCIILDLIGGSCCILMWHTIRKR